MKETQETVFYRFLEHGTAELSPMCRNVFIPRIETWMSNITVYLCWCSSHHAEARARGERGRGEEGIRRQSIIGSILPNPEKCSCRTVMLSQQRRRVTQRRRVETHLKKDLFECLISHPQRFIRINTQKISLYFVCCNKTLKGLKTFCVGRTVLCVRKHSGDSEVYPQTIFVFNHIYLSIWQLSLDTSDKRHNDIFIHIPQNRAAQSQNVPLYLFMVQTYFDLGADYQVSASSTSNHPILFANMSHLH